MAKTIKKNIRFDIAVIGAGPAGMMAAICAAKDGARVVLVEKNDAPGKKLLLTGGGRCNFTNNEKDLRKLVANYGATGPFLFHSFSEFGPQDAVKFFNDLGVKTVVENNQRAFPESGQAQEILDALAAEIRVSGVEMIFNASVLGFQKIQNDITAAILPSGEKITAKNYVISVGGKSYPATGSKGDGYDWARALGHRIIQPAPSLVPVSTKEEWTKKISGIPIGNSKITVFQDSNKKFSFSGEFLFTHFGLSGPAILNASGEMGDLLKKGEVSLSIDLFPDIARGQLDGMLIENFRKNPNRVLKNCLSDMMPQGLSLAVSQLANIGPEKIVNGVTREERSRLISVLKGLRLTVLGLLDIEAGMVTNGGVSTEDIDDKTMRSKIVRNLFFAGEIINVHGRTGGFNLQQSWSTGHLAGSEAAGSGALR